MNTGPAGNVTRFIYDRDRGLGVGPCFGILKDERRDLLQRFQLRQKIEVLMGIRSSKRILADVGSPTLDDVETVYPNGAAVFGLEFSKDETSLLTAHSDGRIRIHDNRTHMLVMSTPKDHSLAHTAAVNGTKVIDDIRFASFSDDMTVQIWDRRFLRDRLKICRGHVGWVKNVHLLRDGTLLSSGCDQTLRAYDLKAPDRELYSDVVCFIEGMWRTQVHPFANTLYISTYKTSVYALHNIDIQKLSSDSLNYYLRSSGHAAFESGKPKGSKPFGGSRNQLDLVVHTPTSGSKACFGQSLIVHPHGNACAVRYSREEIYDPEVPRIEWLSVYDVSSVPNPPERTTTAEDNSKEVQRWLHGKGYKELHAEAKLESWQTVASGNSLEVDLLQHSVAKQRASLLFKEWTEDPSENPSTTRGDSNSFAADGAVKYSMTSQDIEHSRYYADCTLLAPSIIKEISFSPCGRLILDPTRFGFRALSYDNWVSEFHPNTTGKRITPQALHVVKEFRLSPENADLTNLENVNSCLTAKFSPDGKLICLGTLEGKIVWLDCEVC